MKNIVYKITNIINDKLYFGVTQQELKIRWQQHKCNSNKKSYYLYNAMKKYGIENFIIEVVFEANTKKEMLEKEIELIALFKTNNRLYGYNNSTGGESSRKGCKLTLEQRKKISEYQKTRIRNPLSQETKEKIGFKNKGLIRSDELKKKWAIYRKGKPAHNICSVSKYSLEGKFIEKYESMTLAAKSVNGNVSAFGLLKKGRLKTYKKFIWKFENYE